MTRLRMLWRIVEQIFDAILHPRTWGRRCVAVLALALPFAGCASTKPLSVACTSCALLQASNLCPSAAARTLAPKMTCPEGQRPEILNYQRWLDGFEGPRVECRRYSIQ
jgi:hypothetical protein